MDEHKQALISRIKETGILKDPQWLERLDEPAPLWVVLDAMLLLLERLDPPNKPFD